MNYLETKLGKIILSIIWGLGLSALFRRACNGRKCIILKGPKPKDLTSNIYQFNNKCYTFKTYNVSCPQKGAIEI